MAVVFTWGSPSTTVAASSCGMTASSCTPTATTASRLWSDRPQIVALYDALRDWLIDHPETVVPPVKDVPHDE
jgi:hypothetical protein